MRKFIILLATIIVTLSPATFACTTGTSAITWSCHELTFESDVSYDHPINDVSIEATFSKSGEPAITVLGYWAGERMYRVRTALPSPGTWQYVVTSSDASNGIAATGTITVVEFEGTDPFRMHGWLRVSNDRRFLAHADATPFFYQGDSAWEMAWGSTESQLGTYIADRQAKGFNVINMVTNSHQVFYPFHVVNLNGTGAPYLLNSDQSLLNPAYFDRLDDIIEQAAEAGMAVGLTPIWGTYGEPHANDPGNTHTRSYSLDEALTHARYVGARYAGHNVIWMIGGDRHYDTEVKRAYWDAFARELRRASGGTHLMTAYPGGYSGSFSFWPSPPEWMDFHMFVASHFAEMRYIIDIDGSRQEDAFGSLNADGGYHWRGALEGFAQEEHLPVLSIESNFEDLPGRFWEFVEEPGGVRITDEEVRQSAYWGLLSGSTVGYNYGANGIWSWTNRLEPGTNGGFQFRYTAIEALDLPGSSQMTALRSFAEAREWYTWIPCPDRVQEIDTDDFVAASAWGHQLVVFAPGGSRSFRVWLPAPTEGALELEWTHPVTGAVTREEVQQGPDGTVVHPPTDGDWLLVARPITGTPTLPTDSTGVRFERVGANPSSSVRLSARSTIPTQASFIVTDMLGRRVRSQTLTLTSEAIQLNVSGVAAGVYVCRLVWTGVSGRSHVARKTITIVH